MNNGYFKKGHVPWNKCLKGFRPSKDTEFKKGRLPYNTKHDGCIILRTKTKNGEKYLYIRLSKANWKLYHRFLWEKQHGLIPKGMIIIFKDNNSLNCDLENLQMINRIENLERNRNRKKQAKTMKNLWRIEKLRIKYERPQQTKLNISNAY